jgi:hypothetical protein
MVLFQRKISKGIIARMRKYLQTNITKSDDAIIIAAVFRSGGGGALLSKGPKGLFSDWYF